MNFFLGSRFRRAVLASTFVVAADVAAPASRAPGPSAMGQNPRLSGGSLKTVAAGAFASSASSLPAAARDFTGDSKEFEAWLEDILDAAAGLTLAAAAALVFRRKRRERDHRLQTLYEIPEMPASPGERQTPRCLPTNPYLDPFAPDMLSRRIENAAEASLEFGRVLGVIYFDLGPRPRGDFSDEARDWDADRSELLGRFRKALRETDHVAELSDREIIACIALLPGRSELVSIAERMREIGQGSARFAKAFKPEAGLATFPACGYRGDELIDYARSDFRARKPSVINFPPPNAPKLEEATPS